jgi:molybdopterin converting factor small subunit
MRVLFFGRLSDVAGASEMILQETPATLSELCGLITRDNLALAEALAQTSVRVALDRRIITGPNADLATITEVAFMAPMSGG